MSDYNAGINRRSFIKYFAAGAGAMSIYGCGGLGHFVKSGDQKPNVLLIVADDLGVEIGCYGDKIAQTPYIDKLAEEGVRFETAWVTQSSCSPSRGSIHTGLYPHQNGLIGLAHRGYTLNRKYPTITSVLKQQGYKTAVIGKYHIEPKSACPWDYQYTDFETHFEGRDVRTTALQAQEFIEKAEDSPFYLFASYIDPHAPLYHQRHGLPEEPLTAEDVQPLEFFGIDTPELREQTAGYYNCISRFDTGVGMLLDKLKKSGKYDNTLIILIGDHGPPFTRAKTSCYNIGLRIPFIVKYPGRTKPGLVRKELISTIDILPTVLDALNLEPPEPLPGKSVLPLTAGKDLPWRQFLLGVHHTHHNFSWFPRRTVRDQRYQLIENMLTDRPNPIRGVDGCRAWAASRDESLEGTKIRKAYDTYRNPPRFELYDLEKDPYCLKNLADEPDYQQLKNKLLAKMNELREETNDPYLSQSYLEKMTAKHDKMLEEREQG